MDEQEKRLMAMPWEERFRLFLWSSIRDSFYRDAKPATVAEAVYNIRQKSGLGSREFAERLYVNQSTISRLETGKSTGTRTLLGYVAELAEEFDMYNTSQYLKRQALFAIPETEARGARR